MTNDVELLPKFPTPAYDASRDDVPINTPLPQFSLINFDMTPTKCCQSHMFQCHVASCTGSERTASREELTKKAELTRYLNKKF